MLWQKRDLQVACLIVPVFFSFYKLFLETAGPVSLVCRNYEKNQVGLSLGRNQIEMGGKGRFQELVKLKYFEMRKKFRESKQTVFRITNIWQNSYPRRIL